MNDTVLLDIATNKITDVAKFDVGQLCMITGGRNTGRVGMVQSLEKHKGSFTIAHIKDAQGNVFSTRSDNVFVIGSGSKPLISLPKGARAARRLASPVRLLVSPAVSSLSPPASSLLPAINQATRSAPCSHLLPAASDVLVACLAPPDSQARV